MASSFEVRDWRRLYVSLSTGLMALAVGRLAVCMAAAPWLVMWS
jgi:hypothetical protein